MNSRTRRLSRLEGAQPDETGPVVVIFRAGEEPQDAAARQGLDLAGRTVVAIPDNGRDAPAVRQ